MSNKPSLLTASIICLLGAMFYLYEFVLQVSPGVITNELMRDLHLTAAGLGTMSAFYYYAYTPMQLPAGLLYDRFGPRRLITIAILICAAGAFFFSMTNGIVLASLGRFLMGIGSAFSFIGALLLVARWFPAKYFALIAGIVQLMSSIGAITGEAPLAAAAAHWGWRDTIEWIAFAGIALAILVFLVVRDNPPGVTIQNNKLSKPGELNRLRSVCGNRETWIVALYTFAIWAPIVAYALWGVPFMVKAFDLSTTKASMICSMLWLGIGIGGPIFGWWSDKIGRRCLPLTLCGLIGLVSASFILYTPNLSITALYVLLFLFGIASSAIAMIFAVVKENNHLRNVGTAIGFNNMACVAGGALFQPLVGIILHLHGSGAIQDGVPVYSVADFRIGLTIIPICYLISAITSAYFMKETYCKQIND